MLSPASVGGTEPRAIAEGSSENRGHRLPAANVNREVRWMPQGFAQGQERFGFRTISRSAKSKRQRWSGRDQDCMKTPSEDAAWDKCYLIQAVFLPK